MFLSYFSFQKQASAVILFLLKRLFKLLSYKDKLLRYKTQSFMTSMRKRAIYHVKLHVGWPTQSPSGGIFVPPAGWWSINWCSSLLSSSHTLPRTSLKILPMKRAILGLKSGALEAFWMSSERAGVVSGFPSGGLQGVWMRCCLFGKRLLGDCANLSTFTQGKPEDNTCSSRQLSKSFKCAWNLDLGLVFLLAKSSETF